MRAAAARPGSRPSSTSPKTGATTVPPTPRSAAPAPDQVPGGLAGHPGPLGPAGDQVVDVVAVAAGSDHVDREHDRRCAAGLAGDLAGARIQLPSGRPGAKGPGPEQVDNLLLGGCRFPARQTQHWVSAGSPGTWNSLESLIGSNGLSAPDQGFSSGTAEPTLAGANGGIRPSGPIAPQDPRAASAASAGPRGDRPPGRRGRAGGAAARARRRRPRRSRPPPGRRPARSVRPTGSSRSARPWTGRATSAPCGLSGPGTNGSNPGLPVRVILAARRHRSRASSG